MNTLVKGTPVLRFSVSPTRPSLSSQLRRNALVDNSSEIKKLAEQCGIYDIALFGSTGRGNAGPQSDIDLLVSMKKSDLLRLSHFQNKVRQLVGYSVDVVPRNNLKPHVAQTIKPEEMFTL
jgi:predicted nucleotidyltransferase